jgi:hypothetical protein
MIKTTPLEMDTEPLNAEVRVRLAREEITALNRIAKQQQLYRSDIVRKALHEYLSTIPKKKGITLNKTNAERSLFRRIKSLQ